MENQYDGSKVVRYWTGEQYDYITEEEWQRIMKMKQHFDSLFTSKVKQENIIRGSLTIISTQADESGHEEMHKLWMESFKIKNDDKEII